MILFDFSDKFIKVLELSPRFLGGKAITAYGRVELKEGLIEDSEIRDPAALILEINGLLKKAAPKPITDREVALVLHDERIYTLRSNPPREKDGKALEEIGIQQAAALLPVPVSSLALVSTGRQFVGVDQKFLSQYLDLFGKLNLEVHLATPESQAIFALIASGIKPGEMAVFLDIGSETTNTVVVDDLGVVQTFTEPVETSQLSRGVVEVDSFIKGKFGKDPDRIFLGGGGVLGLDQKKFAAEAKHEVVSVEDILKTYPIQISVNFGQTSRLGFLNLFGLALLLEQKNPINFVHRS